MASDLSLAFFASFNEMSKLLNKKFYSMQLNKMVILSHLNKGISTEKKLEATEPNWIFCLLTNYL